MAIPLGTQALVQVMDLVRVLEVDGVDLEALRAGRGNDVVARVMVAQLDIIFDKLTLAAREFVPSSAGGRYTRQSSQGADAAGSMPLSRRTCSTHTVCSGLKGGTGVLSP